MTVLVLGLLLFLGVHSVRALAPGLRDAGIRRLGAGGWRIAYSLISIAGFVLIIYGYGLARAADPQLLWLPPAWLRHPSALLTLPAFILVVAAYVPGNHFKAWIGHPMLAGVKLWALAHLLASGWLHSMIVFVAFLVWAVVAFARARRRDRLAGVVQPPGRWLPTMTAIAVGTGLWAGFALYLHARWIGVAPFG